MAQLSLQGLTQFGYSYHFVEEWGTRALISSLIQRKSRRDQCGTWGIEHGFSFVKAFIKLLIGSWRKPDNFNSNNSKIEDIHRWTHPPTNPTDPPRRAQPTRFLFSFPITRLALKSKTTSQMSNCFSFSDLSPSLVRFSHVVIEYTSQMHLKKPSVLSMWPSIEKEEERVKKYPYINEVSQVFSGLSLASLSLRIRD